MKLTLFIRTAAILNSHSHSFLTNDHALRHVSLHTYLFSAGYDCPVIPDLYDFVSLVAGSSICAAKCLVNREGVNKICCNIIS